MLKASRHQYNLRTCCYEILVVATTNTCSLLKWLGRNWLYLTIDQSQLERDILCLSIERTQVTTWVGLLMSLEEHQLWFDLPHRQLTYENGTLWAGADNNWCTRAGGRLHAFDLSLIRKTLSFVPNSSKNLMTVYKKNLPHRLNLANPFPPDLLGYMHGFSY